MAKAATKPKNLPAHVSISKTGVYRYRRRVPDHLVETLGKREVKESLGKDYGAALKRHAVLHPSVEKMFAQKPRKNSNAEIKVLSKLREYGLELQAIAASRRDGADPNAPDDLIYAIDAALEELERDREIPPEMIRSVAKGELVVTLEKALDDYREYKKTGQPIADRVANNRNRLLKERLAAHLGKDALSRRPLRNLRRHDVNLFVEWLIAETSPATARRYLNDINAAVNRAILRHELDCANPFMKQETKGGQHTKDKRLPLDDEEMKALAPIMETDDDLGTIWVTLRDTGARLNEIVGLRGCDVDEGRKTIWIRAHEARSIKTGHSEREIPIPDAVLARLAALKGKTADAPLFPRYVRERGNDTCSQTLNKRLRRAVKEPRKSAYSLRHRMKDMLRDTDCPESLQREIMGHSDQSSAANYGRGSSLERKRAALEKVWS